MKAKIYITRWILPDLRRFVEIPNISAYLDDSGKYSVADGCSPKIWIYRTPLCKYLYTKIAHSNITRNITGLSRDHLFRLNIMVCKFKMRLKMDCLHRKRYALLAQIVQNRLLLNTYSRCSTATCIFACDLNYVRGH